MREILFRGKQVGNDKWVEGGYYENNTGKYIISPALVAHLVIPETVGQFTGLTDCNGVKIFEGDIISYNDWYGEWSGVVKYDSDDAKFIVRLTDNDIADFGDLCCGDCKVYGNVHDNPELLEVSGNEM